MHKFDAQFRFRARSSFCRERTRNIGQNADEARDNFECQIVFENATATAVNSSFASVSKTTSHLDLALQVVTFDKTLSLRHQGESCLF